MYLIDHRLQIKLIFWCNHKKQLLFILCLFGAMIHNEQDTTRLNQALNLRFGHLHL